METILDKIVDQKKLDVAVAKSKRSLAELRLNVSNVDPPKDFLAALRAGHGVSLIAEVKKASPSKGVIRQDFDPVAIARIYANSGASCISVLTDEKFFQGHLDYLCAIRQAVGLPLLRKDFVIDPYQVLEARVAGADAVLLIAECLTASQLNELHDQIVELGMTPLVELYEPENLEMVLNSGAKLIGINNRNLKTFETDLSHCTTLRKQIPNTVTVVGESGIFTPSDVAQLAAANIDAMLVGESLMRSDDIAVAVAHLLMM